MNITKLNRLIEILEGVEDKYYRQNFFINDENYCFGCAAFHYKKAEKEATWGNEFLLDREQSNYIFGDIATIEEVAHRNNWPIAQRFKSKDAIDRIKFIINQSNS